MTNALQRGIASILLVVWCATAIFDGPFVLCVETDGRVTVEAFGRDCCPTAFGIGGGPGLERVASRPDDAGSSISPSDRCAGCVDIQIDVGAGMKSSVGRASLPERSAVPPASHPSPCLTSISRISTGSPVHGRSESRPFLAEQRSVVLRC